MTSEMYHNLMHMHKSSESCIYIYISYVPTPYRKYIIDLTQASLHLLLNYSQLPPTFLPACAVEISSYNSYWAKHIFTMTMRMI